MSQGKSLEFRVHAVLPERGCPHPQRIQRSWVLRLGQLRSAA